MRRALDILFSCLAIIVTSPLIAACSMIIWAQDGKSPIYRAKRVGKNGEIFIMLKLRSMIWGAEQNQVDSTKSTDNRITPIGKFTRKFKIDEFPQFWNVLRGEMSLVGPRPNVQRETDIYTLAERNLLTVRPGITDIASIVFSDLAQILEPHPDANIAYNQLVRPWKSRLSLACIENASIKSDIRILYITAIAVFNRKSALIRINRILAKWNTDEKLQKVALRNTTLTPHPPLGSNDIVEHRNK